MFNLPKGSGVNFACLKATTQPDGVIAGSCPDALRRSKRKRRKALMLQTVDHWVPPAPGPRERQLGTLALIRVLASNPLEAWTVAHFEQPVVAGGLPFARALVVSEPGAIRRVLLENAENYPKDWMQRRILSAGLADGPLSAEGRRWRVPRRALAPREWRGGCAPPPPPPPAAPPGAGGAPAGAPGPAPPPPCPPAAA